MSDDDAALREFALALFSSKRDNTAARLFAQQGDPDVIPGGYVLGPLHLNAGPEHVHDDLGWHGVVDPNGASWLFGGDS